MEIQKSSGVTRFLPSVSTVLKVGGAATAIVVAAPVLASGASVAMTVLPYALTAYGLYTSLPSGIYMTGRVAVGAWSVAKIVKRRFSGK